MPIPTDFIQDQYGLKVTPGAPLDVDLLRALAVSNGISGSELDWATNVVVEQFQTRTKPFTVVLACKNPPAEDQMVSVQQGPVIIRFEPNDGDICITNTDRL